MARKYNYRELMSEKSYLMVKIRAMRLSGTFIDRIYYNEKDLLFRTRSGTDPTKVWYQTIRIEDLRTLDDLIATKDLDRVIRESGIKVHCNCPAFLYWGFKYLSWKKGYGLQKELRVPRVRNPHQRGYVCKHIYQCLMVYPFLSKTIAAKMKRYYSSEQSQVKKSVSWYKNGNNTDSSSDNNS
nr:MAG TPA: hypothetical protein [Caudoviricetes sp.]